MSGAADLAGAREVVAVSPHLDDAAFSAGAALAGLAAAGARVRVLTVFTATVPDPQGFALACQLDKGLAADVDYMALRRAEDDAAMAALGARGEHLGLPEAPHRGYGDAPALFGPVLPGDVAQPAAVLAALERALDAGPAPDLLLGPLALGDHVDHRHVRDAVLALAARRGLRLLLWRDTPYVLRPGAPAPSPGDLAVPVGPAALDAKAAACRAYATQLGFQFGGADGAERAVRALAAAEGARLLGGGAAEALAVPPGHPGDPGGGGPGRTG
ncbi:PIG-L family deacetylase [Vallicoccus soli]|uniref:PIG-L family deacetylase n=1 Tax=Vallicoccus soli TaxID=2339232 RepID=A0A3A3YXC8_9ACTN|nr:PIG-L family deacetylase [Vallicoccus soli]RJK96329.1 PIG-L family deacetylase [Vallicoccus soli]